MKKYLNILLALVLSALCAFSLTACVDNSQEGQGQKGLHIKKMNGIYTIYDYVEEDSLTDGVLDIGAILSQKGYDNVTIKRGAFDGVSNVKKLIVSDRVSVIENGAFRNIKGLEELEVPFIGKNAMADAYFNQTDAVEDKSVDLERTFAHFFGSEQYDGATAMMAIDESVVYMPIQLKTVTVNVTDKVFYDVNDAEVKDKFYSIPYQAFMGATNLEKIIIKSCAVVDGKLGLQEIGERAFSGCSALKEIVIPESVKTIYKNAFENCINLEKVDIKGSEVVVKEDAFIGCVKMDKFNSQNALTVDLNNFKEIGKGALDFGRDQAKYSVVNAGSFDLDRIFGETDKTAIE